jgi:hypothetical protein
MRFIWESLIISKVNLGFILICVLVSGMIISCGIAGGGEASSPGVPVPIPRVFINCTTGNCLQNTALNPRVFVLFTTSGCSLAPDYGATLSATLTNVSCLTSTGCYAEVTGWVDAKGVASSTIPSGTYSICARIDYNRDYPATTSGDSYGALDNVAVAQSTANEFITSFANQ